MAERIRVLVADDHELFRRGLVEFLKEQPDFVLAGEASDGHQAVQLGMSGSPDVVLLDIHMPGGNGIEAVRRLKEQSDARVLMLTVSEHDSDLMAALEAGADGYLLKNTKPARLCEAIREIVAGGGVLSPEVTQTVMRAAAQAGNPGTAIGLSPREGEVLALLARGASTSEIATTLIISPNTVKTHIRRILTKLEASNRTEAVARAAALGLLYLGR